MYEDKRLYAKIERAINHPAKSPSKDRPMTPAIPATKNIVMRRKIA
jgi:hypothetical protein